MLGDGKLTHLPGGVDDYLARQSGDTGFAPSQAAARSQAAGKEPRGPKVDSRQAKKDLSRLERTIDRLQQREAGLHEQLTQLDTELRAVQQERSEAEDAWLALADES
jgi:septal ring factor EnvC (AmiA/AmiB activator)